MEKTYRLMAQYGAEQMKELQEIVTQLTTFEFVKGQPIYIHPLDASELFAVDGAYGVIDIRDNGFTFMGREYKMSCNIPARTRNMV